MMTRQMQEKPLLRNQSRSYVGYWDHWYMDSTAADNHSALESPFDSSSYINNDPQLPVMIWVSTTNLATQLGTVPTLWHL